MFDLVLTSTYNIFHRVRSAGSVAITNRIAISIKDDDREAAAAIAKGFTTTYYISLMLAT